MLMDVQGIENLLTDPAIVTTAGGFDLSDIGIRGMSYFLTQFKGTPNKYLAILDIERE
jgi:hypothetical protein